jgi:hypothetical protein
MQKTAMYTYTTNGLYKRVPKIAERDYELCHVRPSAWNNSDRSGRIFIKFDMSVFRKIVGKIQIKLKSDKNNGHFTWRFLYISYHISPISS